MKKNIWIAALVAVIAVTGVAWSTMGTSETVPTTTNPRAEVPQELGWNNMHAVFVEEYLQFGKMEQSHYEVWYNDQGHYRLNSNAGSNKGSFSIWDGETYHQYNSVTREMMVDQIEKGVPVAHPIMSGIRLSNIQEEIKSGKMKKKAEATLLEFDVTEYEKVEEGTEASPDELHFNPGIFKEKGNKRTTIITLDSSQRFILGEMVYINDQLYRKTTFKTMEKHTFDETMLKPNPPAGTNIHKVS